MTIGINEVALIQFGGVVLGLIIGLPLIDKLRIVNRERFRKVTLIVSFSMIIGFLISTLIIFLFLLPQPKPQNVEETYESIKNQTNFNYNNFLSPEGYDKYVGFFTFAGLAAGGIFAGMLGFLKLKKERWDVMSSLFFLLATILFIGFLALAFRWWWNVRDLGGKISVDDVLNLEKLLKIKYSNYG